MAQGLGSGFTSAEILAMQKDAVRRVNEMQRIAQEKLKNSPAVSETNGNISNSVDSTATFSNKNNTANSDTNSINKDHESSQPHQNRNAPDHGHHIEPDASSDAILTYHDDSGNIHHPQDCYPKNSPATGFAGILQQLNLDDEKIIIILLLILLVNEGADTMLILALVYILL